MELRGGVTGGSSRTLSVGAASDVPGRVCMGWFMCGCT